MKRMLVEMTAVCLVSLPIAVGAQGKAEAKLDNTPIELLIEAVAKNTGKKIIVDPRVRAQVSIYGINISSVSYKELLAILSVNNFAAVESEGLVYVLPEVEVRFMAIPTVSGSKHYDDNEFVTTLIPVKSIPAATLIPALRPMLPQYAHLASISCANSLIVVDHFANVKRIQNVVEQLDKGEPMKLRDCTSEEAKK